MKQKQEFKLGKLQEFWLTQLEEHPERQLCGELGEGTPKNYRACCLGELHFCNFRLKRRKLPFILAMNGNHYIEDNGATGLLEKSFSKYGLRDSAGRLLKPAKINGKMYDKLSAMNDNGVTWPQIAKYIRKYPENVFVKSV